MHPIKHLLSTTLLLATLLSGCGGGSIGTITNNNFGGNNQPCTPGLDCIPDNAGTGGTTTTGLTPNNFIQVANKFTQHVDNLNRWRSTDAPPSLASLSIQLLQKKIDTNRAICLNDPNNPNPTISVTDPTFTIQTCKIQAGANVYIVDGTVSATQLSQSGTITSTNTPWSLSYDFNTNLTITLDVTNPNNDLTFNGQYSIDAELASVLTTTLTTSNLDIQDTVNGTTDTFPSLVITNVTSNITNPAQQQALTINGSFTSSVTNSTLDVSTSQALVWTGTMVNPDADAAGQLSINDATSNSLSLQPNPGFPMVVSLSDGSTSSTSW